MFIYTVADIALLILLIITASYWLILGISLCISGLIERIKDKFCNRKE